jgi:FkbM family methyltransferase
MASTRVFKNFYDRGVGVELFEAEIETFLGNLPLLRDVVIVSDQPRILKKYYERPGLLPVLLCAPDITPSVHSRWIEVASLEEIIHLFDASLSNVLSLLRLNVVEARKAQDAIGAEFLGAVRAVGGLHIFGAGTIGYQVLYECRRSDVVVRGFLDNNPQLQGSIQDMQPIRNPAELDSEREVVVVAVGNHAKEITQQLRVLGFRYVFNLSQFFYALSVEGQPETGYLNDIYENRLQWIALALRLQDTQSRSVINAVIKHRVTLDTKHLAAVKDVGVTQWFDPEFIKPNPRAVFVDGGAFDGDTAEAFRKFNGPAQAIHAFELDPEIAARAKLRLAIYSEAVVHPQGLSDGPARIPFVSSGITDGRIDASALSDRYADVVSVDETVHEDVTYLKLDVEGAESLAISGAKVQIRTNSPVIGLAAYHKPGDPWLLTTQLMALNKTYQYFMRHYTDLGFETVIYAIPTSATHDLN